MIGVWPTEQLQNKNRVKFVNFPPPQFPPPSPQPAPLPQNQVRQPRVRFNKHNRNQFSASNAFIAINLGLFVWGLIIDASRPASVFGISRFEYDMGLAREFLDYGEWYRIVSSAFLHFGVLHIGMNMFLLYQLGRMIEPAIGSAKFALVYVVSLLGGAAGALVVSPTALTGGASGAVFGMMAAAVVGMRQRGVNPLQTGLGATFVLNLLFTFAIPNISVGGHIGGAIAGALCGVFVLAPAQWRLPRWSEYVAPLAIGTIAMLIAVTPSL